MKRLPKTLIAISGTLAIAAGTLTGAVVANAAPGDPGSVEWVDAMEGTGLTYWALINGEDETAADAEWAATRTTENRDEATGNSNTSCYASPTDARVVTGLDDHPNASDGGIGWKPLIYIQSNISTAQYNTTPSFAMNFMATDCAEHWDLSGEWALTRNGLRSNSDLTVSENIDDPTTFDSAGYGTNGIISTPAGWSDFADGSLASTTSAQLFLRTNGGDWLEAGFMTTVSVPGITAQAANFTLAVGEYIDIDLSLLSIGCNMTDGTTCAPTSVLFTSAPDGATGDAGGPLHFEATEVGTFNFSYILDDSASGASSGTVFGSIEVLEDAPSAPIAPRLSDKSFSTKVGQTLHISQSELIAGCSWVSLTLDGDGSILSETPFTPDPAMQTCEAAMTNALEVTNFDGVSTLWAFNSLTDADAAFTYIDSIDFTPTAPGVYTFTFWASWDKGYTTARTATIVVTQDEVRKPVVTG